MWKDLPEEEEKEEEEEGRSPPLPVAVPRPKLTDADIQAAIANWTPDDIAGTAAEAPSTFKSQFAWCEQHVAGTKVLVADYVADKFARLKPRFETAMANFKEAEAIMNKGLENPIRYIPVWAPGQGLQGLHFTQGAAYIWLLTDGGRPRPKEGLGETMVHETAHEVGNGHDTAWYHELGRLWAEEVASVWPSDWRRPRLARP